MRSLKVLLLAACFSGVAMSQSQAADLPKQGKFAAKFGWYAVGKVFELEKDHIFWVGEFSGTVFNDSGSGFMHMVSMVCPGSNDIHLDGQQGSADGYCVMTDKDGDKLYSVWSCKGPFPGPCDGDNKFTGGTGKYAGITGSNRFQGVTTAPTSSGYSTFMNGAWQLP
jgi:hypothetical protein